MTLEQYVKKVLTEIRGNVSATIDLLIDGATVPFIARYRKELTGGLDEVEIEKVKISIKDYNDIIARKKTILDSIEEQQKLTSELKKTITNTWDYDRLEDIYLPYKRKRKTRADKAREAGLEGLAKILMAQRESDVNRSADRFLKGNMSVEDALQGARDIIAEWISENSIIRDIIRQSFDKYATISSKAKKVKEVKKQDLLQHYRDYWQYSSRLDRTPGHRLLAILRGETLSVLSVSLDIDANRVLNRIDRFYIKSQGDCASQLSMAIDDSYKRLLKPSIANETLKKAKEKADIEAIEVFAKNLRQLLLEAPLGEVPVLAIDPGFRTGCKVAVLSRFGDLLTHTTIFPHPPQNDKVKAAQKLQTLIEKYDIKHVAIGNGTAGRETESHIKNLEIPALQVFLISEAGASIYSASSIAREEFPDLDLTVRGAISIGRRLKDPLAELIKIDPKSIGVGQYQHDVNQVKLKQSLESVVVSCVNAVGINLNTASSNLLSFVSGIGPTLAKKIVSHRENIGQFKDRSQLKKVSGLGAKSYEQSAGFLRVKQGTNPLDDSGVHPERYTLVKKMTIDLNINIENLLGNKFKVNEIVLENYKSDKIGLPTLRDIKGELIKPGIDPRGNVEVFDFYPNLRSIEDIHEGMILPGIVVNVAKFGAFVDIGIKENGLVHVSQITDRFITDPNEVLAVNQKIQAKVIGVEKERKRIQLSLKF